MKQYRAINLTAITLLSCISLFSKEAGDGRKFDNFLPGSIVTNSYDTISGFILLDDHVFNASKCVFKESKEGNSTTYTANDLLGYYIDNNKYYVAHSLILNGVTQRIFMECVVDGKKSLFFFRERFFLRTSEKTEELVSKTDKLEKEGKVYTVTLPIYKGLLQKEMNDCAEIHQKLQSTKFSMKSLMQLVVSYHSCIGYDPVIYATDAEKINIRLGFSVGVLASHLKLSSGDVAGFTFLDGHSGDWNVSFTPSIWLEIGAPTHSIQIRTGLTYYAGKYRIYDENTSTNLSHELTVETSSIEVPVQLKYNPLIGSGLYVFGGLGLNAVLTWDDQHLVKVLPDYLLSEYTDLENSKLFINLTFGMGLEFPLGKKSFFIQPSYAWGPSILKSSSSYPTGSLGSFVISTGLMF